MYINKITAENIIREMKNVVDYHINIINNNAFIIASTDPRRVNNYHEGAHMILSKNFTELIVEEDDQFEGCKKGVNLPIFFSNEIIGVVGITGKPEEVVRYARIIQKMTEMILHENFDLWNRNNNEQIKLVFANDLINGIFRSSFFEIEERLQKYNLNVKGTFSVALIKYGKINDEDRNSKLTNARHNTIKKYIIQKIGHKNSMVTFNGELFIIISNLCLDELRNEIEYLFLKVQEIYNIPLVCTIGNIYESYEDIPKSYNEASSIIQYLKGGAGVYEFSKTSLNFALNNIPENLKKTLKNQVFAKCSQAEIQEFTPFIKEYVMCNGSLNDLAEKYFIHKNTVQYRIQKIKDKTDYDLRSYSDMLFIYLASLF